MREYEKTCSGTSQVSILQSRPWNICGFKQIILLEDCFFKEKMLGKILF